MLQNTETKRYCVTIEQSRIIIAMPIMQICKVKIKWWLQLFLTIKSPDGSGITK